MAEQDGGRRRGRTAARQGASGEPDPRSRSETGTERRRSRRPSSVTAQPVSPTGSRQRQRAAERARRRSLRRRRIALAAAILVVTLGLALGLNRVLGGGSEPAGDPAAEATVTTGPVFKEDAYLVRITEGGEMAAALFVSAADPAVMIGLPGATLVRGPNGFAALAELWGADDPATASAGAADLTGIEPAGTASIEWTAVLDALSAAGMEAEYPLDLVPGAAETGASVAEALAILGAQAAGIQALDRLLSQGDDTGAAEAIGAVVDAQGVVGGLPGREVEGLDYRYFEADTDGLARLLGGSVAEEAVSVEVQNGSGSVGIAQQVSEVLAPLGYTMLPPKNADGFPDVEVTQINAGAAVVGEADRIRGILGMGKVVQQDGLPPAQIVIVIGKDLDAAALPEVGEG